MRKSISFFSIMTSAFMVFAMSSAHAAESAPPTVTAEKPIKVGDICLWQDALLTKETTGWHAQKCVPGVATIEGKGKINLNISDGVLFLYPHQGKPTQNPPYASLVRVQDDLFGGREKVKAWAAKNGVPIHDPYKQL